MNLDLGTFEVRLASAPSLTAKVAGRLLTTTEAAVHLGLTGDKLTRPAFDKSTQAPIGYNSDAPSATSQTTDLPR